jgi:hypothetical protein
MALITVSERGSFKNTERLLKKDIRKETIRVLQSLGQRGVDALSAATPVRTGKTAASWRFEVNSIGKRVILSWHNDNKTSKGDNIVILLIRGHGTSSGYYVRGNDFVTPAMEPIFEEIAQKAWLEVTK